MCTCFRTTGPQLLLQWQYDVRLFNWNHYLRLCLVPYLPSYQTRLLVWKFVDGWARKLSICFSNRCFPCRWLADSGVTAMSHLIESKLRGIVDQKPFLHRCFYTRNRQNPSGASGNENFTIGSLFLHLMQFDGLSVCDFVSGDFHFGRCSRGEQVQLEKEDIRYRSGMRSLCNVRHFNNRHAILLDYSLDPQKPHF